MIDFVPIFLHFRFMTTKDNKVLNYGEKYAFDELCKICVSNEEKNGFRVILRGDYHWEVQIYKFHKNSEILKDLKKYKSRTGKDYISLHLTFPENYPTLPPFIRVAEPRLMPQPNGPITKGGAVVIERISKNGWRDSIDLEELLKEVATQIRDSNVRIDFSTKEPYSIEKAKVTFKSAAKELGYNISYPINDIVF